MKTISSVLLVLFILYVILSFVRLFNESNPKNRFTIKNNSKTLVVFLHGLGGDINGTWGKFHQLLPADTNLKVDNFDILLYGYNTGIFVDAPKAEKIASSLVTFLTNQEHQYDNFIFVCHSLGGIILKKAMILLKDKSFTNNQKKPNIPLVFFFATPHFKNNLEKHLGNNFVSYFNNDQMQDLNYDNLEKTHYQWQEAVPDTLRVVVITAEEEIIVDDTNNFPNKFIQKNTFFEQISGTYTEIVKPDSSNHMAIRIVVKQLNSVLGKEIEPITVTPRKIVSTVSNNQPKLNMVEKEIKLGLYIVKEHVKFLIVGDDTIKNFRLDVNSGNLKYKVSNSKYNKTITICTEKARHTIE